MTNREHHLQISLPASVQRTLFGSHDRHLVKMEKTFQVKISARGGKVTLRGKEENVALVGRILMELSDLMESGHPLNGADIENSIDMASHNHGASLTEFFSEGEVQPSIMRFVQPRSPKQKLYLEAIKDDDMVIAIGPAGTGKTYLAVGMACAYLMEHKVRRIILTQIGRAHV